jgi:hypothetical protein
MRNCFRMCLSSLSMSLLAKLVTRLSQLRAQHLHRMEQPGASLRPTRSKTSALMPIGNRVSFALPEQAAGPLQTTQAQMHFRISYREPSTPLLCNPLASCSLPCRSVLWHRVLSLPTAT